MLSPAESVCGSTGELPVSLTPDKSEQSSHWSKLQKENSKLKRKLAVLKEKAEGTEELLSVYRELRTKHTELQFEFDDLRSKKNEEEKLKQQLTEAENQVQLEFEKRTKLQKQLSQALERCESEQDNRISLLEQMRQEQETLLLLKNENSTLKRKLEELTEEQKRAVRNWKEFELDLTKLVNRTGSAFAGKVEVRDLRTPEIASQIGSDLVTPSDGLSEDGGHTVSIVKSTPIIESSNLSPESTISQIKTSSRKQQSVDLTARMILSELRGCTDQECLANLVSKTQSVLNEKQISLQDLIRSLCDCFLSCCSSTLVTESPLKSDLYFLIPWCEAGSSNHTFFCILMVFILHLDEMIESDLIKFLTNELLELIMRLMEQQRCLMACALAAALGQLCTAKNENQILSTALVEVLSIEENSTAIPVLSVLLHCCPELLSRSSEAPHSSLFDLLVACLAEMTTTGLSLVYQEAPVVQLCCQKILSCGFEHQWWSTVTSHEPMTVKLPTGLTPDQQIEKFMSFHKTLLLRKNQNQTPEGLWFEMELGFVIITKHKGYHWIKGVTTALLVHWIKEMEMRKLTKFGRVMGSVYARLLTRYKHNSSQFIGVVSLFVECIQSFEKRLLKPRQFLQEFLYSFWSIILQFLDNNSLDKLDQKDWKEFQDRIVELRSSSAQSNVTSVLEESISERLLKFDMM